MPRKKYSDAQKYAYHKDRVYDCSKHAISFGDNKFIYSLGFVDGFKYKNNSSNYFGKSKTIYNLAYKRGRSSASSYFRKTGKQPSDL